MQAATLPVLLGLLLSVLALGRWLGRRVIHVQQDPLQELMTWTITGLALMSGAILLLGHLSLLHAPVLWMLLAAGSVWALTQRPGPLDVVRQSLVKVRPRSAFGWALLVITVLVQLMLVAGALRPPRATDELEYHWASPLYWAAAGRWEDSPYKLSDSFALSEVLYTLPAVTGGYVLAHLVHVLFYTVLLAATACVARRIGAPASIAVAGVASMPVVLNQASWSYNDVAAASYCVCALAVLLSRAATTRHLLLVGLLGAAAVSTKPFCVVIGPALAAVLVLRDRSESVQWSSTARRVVVLAVPLILACAFWLLRSLAITGSLSDGDGVYLARGGDDPALLSGAAAGRIPSAGDLIRLPAVPFITGVVGQQEPYGGRTGLLLLLLLPLLVATSIVVPRYWRQVRVVLVPAAIWLALLGPVLIKTRFHIFAYVMLTIAGAHAFDTLRSRTVRGSRLLQSAVVVLVVLSAFGDSGRVLVRDLGTDMADGPGERAAPL